jgi:serine/threonine-protein kinase HipA
MIKKAKAFVNGVPAGEIQEIERGKKYRFIYLKDYKGPSVSLEMPLNQLVYEYDRFPPFFEGLLPEGMMLEGLLRHTKIDRGDLLGQLIAVGGDLVGNVTVEAIE